MAGGATSGYCDTGIFGIDSRPARAIPSATTQAKIGRSIKNCGMFTHFLEALKLPIGAPCTTGRSEEHTSELQSLMRISYAVFCLKKKKNRNKIIQLC